MKRIKRILPLLLCLMLPLVLLDVPVRANGEITSWAQLQTMLADASTDAEHPTEITLTQSLTAGESDGALTVAVGKYVTLDLAGFTLDRGLGGETAESKNNGNVITVNGTLTLADSDSGSGGTLTGGYHYGWGGGVSVERNGTFTLTGGTITGNRTSGHLGGGVSVENGGTFAMRGGAITGNRGGADGGGVYVRDGGTFKLSGLCTISDNYNNESPNNVCSAEAIVVDGALNANTRVGITIMYSEHKVTFTNGFGANSGLDSAAICFFSDAGDDGRILTDADSGEGVVEVKEDLIYTEQCISEGAKDVSVTSDAAGTVPFKKGWTGDYVYVWFTLKDDWVPGRGPYDNAEYDYPVYYHVKDGYPIAAKRVSVSGSRYCYRFPLIANPGEGDGLVIQAYRPAYGVSIDYDDDKSDYSLSYSEDGYLYSGEYHAGETVTLTLKPGDGLLAVVTGAYLLDENDDPTETAVVLTQNESNPNVYTFTMPAGDVGVYVEFVTAALTNGKAYAPAGATLLLATYEGGRMTGAQSVTLNAVSVGKTLAQLGLTVPTDGTHYKVFLVGGNYAPLIAAFDSAPPSG